MMISVMNTNILSILIAFSASQAFAQSTITLESFALEPETPAVEAQAVPGASAAPSSELETCLTDPANCTSADYQSGSTFSLEDVVNLAIIDREEVTQQVSSTGGQAASTATEPLPSVDMEILFDYNSDSVRGDQLSQLADLAALLKSERFDAYRFLFLGHTDAKGSAAYNEDLSARRAESVAALVRGLGGLQADRTLATGMGFSRLKTPGDPLSGQNRRVQLVLLPR
ncbi:OmpA family protein [Parasedimentitalea marina]|uniref:OmpA family protein n=2 Tax=Parasedimentitalea marina TaxID=2483033 RepID=A0A3T0N754_9RHOB|nr:OmpA family protein [Parasedimentitalea marina]